MDKIIIIDFGSQYTQLIAKQIRKLKVYSEVVPYNKFDSGEIGENIKGLILSGSPHSVIDGSGPILNEDFLKETTLPILGICYGSQLLAKVYGEDVTEGTHREFGRHTIDILDSNTLLKNIRSNIDVWMSHNDTISSEKNIQVLAKTSNDVIAIFKVREKNIYGLQYHPEVSHTLFGRCVFNNFLKICRIKREYTVKNFIKEKIAELKEKIGDDEVIMAVSGGVDSTVAATLLHKAIGKNLHCVFINNGFLRKGEDEDVPRYLREYGLNLSSLDESNLFFEALEGIYEPEEKRKGIGTIFIKLFEQYARNITVDKDIKWLGQGTIYPDVIESVPGFGLIKSHHNVGGLPDDMEMDLVEPLRELFKDEVREVGKALDVPDFMIKRHPFPGPGLAIRIMGDLTREKTKILQEADAIFMQKLKDENLYDKIWQAGVVLLSTKSVGVMGDMRTYEYVAALRAVNSENGMTAEPYDFDGKFLREISTEIINKVEGINRVVYDVSSKPPATIEWE